ncbi:sphingomyelin phosphodiesterase-like isoform X3 [Varroa jacobsoni]|nr:sphingomyelin phosphodiesterase-like isoform X3 [Varroa jacobsoni]XP_022694616.1 sphingomyelin phosphodiesterase-like isoform X3 [Varroa jacobsoni]XP_022694617.1 sphingomyelin phosphodiesterase-like isoform X3 [Varroa jacobsoni]
MQLLLAVFMCMCTVSLSLPRREAASFAKQLLTRRFEEEKTSSGRANNNNVTQPSTSYARCLLCKATISIVNEFLSKAKSGDNLVAILKFGCKTLRIETEAVCNGIIPLFKDMLFAVISQSPLSPHDICSIVFNNECGELTEKSNWTVATSGVPKPPVKPISVPSDSAPKLRIAHITDTHVDYQYAPGSNANCADPLCCHTDSTQKKGSSVGADNAGFWGTYVTCDIPERTLISALKYIEKQVKPDYIYWTGDIISHNVWQTTREGNLRQFNRTLDVLRMYVPDVKVIPVIGNHEGVPVNSFPIPQITGRLSVTWLYESLADVWSHYIPEQNLKTFRKGGFYSYDLSSTLRVISLNMNYCNTYNWWLLINSTDPTDQLKWLTNQLQECEDKGIKVHVMGHIPPGQSDCLSVWSRNFNDIVNRYENTIAGHFYGHTHFDEFAIFFDKENTTRPFATAYVAPSITTFCSGKPTFRVYDVDGIYDNSTYQVLDIETHSMNLEEANRHPTDMYSPTWDVIPSIKQHYKLDSLRPEAWAKYVERIRVDEGAFKDFFAMYMKQLPNITYTEEDRKMLLCRLLRTRSEMPCQP